MPESTTLPTSATPPAAPPSQADARKPWHAPTLTEVALQVTGQASGTTGDKAGSTTAF